MSVNPGNLSLTLFVPGLMRFKDSLYRELVREIPHPQQRLPALELIMSRGEKSSHYASTFESTAFDLFRVTRPENGDYPIGALSYYLQFGEASRLWYMRADPVYLQPNRDHLLLLGNHIFDINVSEAKQLVGDINKTYHDMPWRMKMLSARRWVIETEQALSLQTHTLSDVTGKNIQNYLPYGNDAVNWRALLNELQMLLHSHPVNRDREMKGMATVNSVWFWGAGQLPASDNNQKPQDYVQCWSDNATVLALARLCRVPRTDLPEDGAAWLKHATTSGQHLLVIEDLNMPASLLDPYDWWQSLLRVERQWLQPLVAALRKGSISKLQVVSDTGHGFYLTSVLSKRWWKRIKELI